MSTAGRVLAVLALLVSVSFIYLASRMLATHRGWRDYVTQLEKDIAAQDANIKKRNTDIDAKRRDLDLEQQAHQQDSVVRTAEVQDQYKRIAVHTDRLREAQTDLARAVDKLDRGKKNLQARVEERDELQKALAQANIDLKNAASEKNRYAKLLEATQTAFTQATETNRRLTARLESLEKKLESSALTRRTLAAGQPSEQEGVVTRPSPTSRTVEFELGDEAPFRVGQQLQIFRLDPDPRYLGKLEVISRNGARAIGRVLPGSDADQIRAGDRVAKEIAAPATAAQRRP